MFEMRRKLPIPRCRSPTVLSYHDVACALVDHRFYRQYHALFQAHTSTLRTEIGHLWLFMKASSNAVTDKFTDHGKPTRLHEGLDSIRDVVEPVPNARLVNRFVKRSPRHVQ